MLQVPPSPLGRQQSLPCPGPAPAPGRWGKSPAPHLTPVRPPAFLSALILDSGPGPHPALHHRLPHQPPGAPFHTFAS